MINFIVNLKDRNLYEYFRISFGIKDSNYNNYKKWWKNLTQSINSKLYDKFDVRFN